MRCLITYDISDVYIRKKISDLLISQGFIRIQRSVFLIEQEIAIEKIYADIEKYSKKIDIKKDSILILPICNQDFIEIEFWNESFESLGKNLKQDNLLIFI